MRVLCVEDEKRIADTIKKGLEQEGYAVDVAYDGISGYDMAASEDYDIILLDRMLPGMDGMKMCSELRKNHVHTPILMLTAKTQTQDKIEGLDIGADDYLAKPFSFDELVARIRALSRRPRKTVGTKITFGDLILDENARSVLKKNTQLALSKKEFAILEHLLRNIDKTISKDEIINHVWDFDADVLPNTVEVNIRNIRQKIGPNVINTIRGFGYRITSHHVS